MTNAILEFEEYPGEEITVRLSPVSLDAFDAIAALYGKAASTMNPKAIRALIERWAPVALVGWTFPEPADAAGMGVRDLNLGVAMVTQWIRAVREVPLPLPRRSSDTERSEVTGPPSSVVPSSATA